MRLLRRLLLLALFVAALVGGWRFAAANGEPVRVHLLFLEAPAIPLWMALLVAFAAGAVLVGAAALYRLAVLRLLTRRYRKTLSGLEAEVHELRSLPLAEESGAAASGEVPERGP